MILVLAAIVSDAFADLKSAAQAFTLESILDRIYVERCYDLPSLTKAVERLDHFVRYCTTEVGRLMACISCMDSHYMHLLLGEASDNR